MKKQRGLGVRYHLVTLSFAAFSLIVYTLFFVFPSILGFGYSFTSWNGISSTAHFIGLQNYREALADQRLFASVGNTILLTAIQCLFFNFGALVLAALVERTASGWLKGALRSLYFIPYVISYVVISVVWSYMLGYREGVINTVLRAVGLGALASDWLGSPNLVMFTIAFVNIWAFSGFYLVTYMSAIQTIPAELYESAAIDGANGPQSFRHITVPMVASAFTVNAVVSVAWGLATFDPILLMTKGGPGFASETIAYYIYWAGFLGARQGYGTTISFILFLFTLVISVIQLKLLRKREVEL